MKTLFALLATTLFAVSFTAQARSPEIISLDTFVSEKDEPLDTFMLRVAPFLENFTKENTWEACGIVGQNEEGLFAVTLGTSKGAITCAMVSTNLPTGFKPLRLTIHSHPEAAAVFPTASDVAYYQANPMEGRMIQRRVPERRKAHAAFSTADFASGPGYVVSHGSLHYQEGPGTEREVAPLSMVPLLTQR